MKSLFLKLKTSGLYSLGFVIVWENPDFLFTGFEDLGLFDGADANLQDGEQGRLVVAAGNNSARHVSGEQEICRIDFAWADESFPGEVVDFTVENIVAKNKNDEDVPIKILALPFEPDETESVLEFVWRVAE